MTNNQNQLDSQVRDWLIEHYTNNDVRFSEKAKEEMVKAHPELADDPNWIEINELCQREELGIQERKYFSSPLGLPTNKDCLTCRPLRYLYQDLISLMSEGITAREAKVEDNEQMQEIWGNSLVTALLVKPITRYYSAFYPEEGMQRLEVIYHQFKLEYGWSEGKMPLQLDAQFKIRFTDLELEHLRSIHDLAVPRVPDAKQKADAYLNSVPGLNRPEDKLTIP